MWTILKVFIEFIAILLLFYVFFDWEACGILSLTRDWTCIPCFGRWSLTHWMPGKSRESICDALPLSQPSVFLRWCCFRPGQAFGPFPWPLYFRGLHTGPPPTTPCPRTKWGSFCAHPEPVPFPFRSCSSRPTPWKSPPLGPESFSKICRNLLPGSVLRANVQPMGVPESWKCDRGKRVRTGFGRSWVSIHKFKALRCCLWPEEETGCRTKASSPCPALFWHGTLGSLKMQLLNRDLQVL